MSITSIPGSDALGASFSPAIVPGMDILSVPVNGHATPSQNQPATPSIDPLGAKTGTDPIGSVTANTGAKTNPYLSAYNSIESASAAALMSSLGSSTVSPLPEYANGSAADGMAQISTMMGALKAGMNAGMFTGNGFDINV